MDAADGPSTTAYAALVVRLKNSAQINIRFLSENWKGIYLFIGVVSCTACGFGDIFCVFELGNSGNYCYRGGDGVVSSILAYRFSSE